MHKKFWKLPDFFSHCTLDVFPIALAHRERATTTYLNANNENIFDFPSKSPDLNTIENIWDKLNHRVGRTVAITATLNQLRAKNSLRVEQPPSELRSVLCDVNETPLSCRSEQCGGDIHATKFTSTWTPLLNLT